MENIETQPRTHRVLLIENADEEARRSVAAMESGPDWCPSIARVRRLSDGIRMLMKSPFDVILLEWLTSDADGLPALAAVRGAAPGVPVVVYSRAVAGDAMVSAIRAGAVECVAKSHLVPEALGPLLVSAIERHRTMVALHRACHEASHRATHDPLTGIANRMLFLDQLDRALALGTRNQQKTGVLFIDLDGFKAINDARGHAIGDALLREVAHRLQRCGRRSDTVARLGGDEFVMLLPDVTSRRDIALVKEQVLELMQAPVIFGDGESLPLGASIGTAMSPLDGVEAAILLEAADADMYREKLARRRRGDRRGDVRDGASVRPQLTDSVTRQREAQLRQAIEQGEVTVHFQPILDVAMDQIIGVEALLRWILPDGTVCFPDQFLPLAEDTGLIVPIGEQVLRQTCEALVRWRRSAPTTSLTAAVNLSTVQLREHGFPATVTRIFAATECPASAITFEITEQQAEDDIGTAFAPLRDLARTGATLCVDAFGVGDASLTFLRDAPIDAIKIDRRFVAPLPVDRRDQAIVTSLIRLARGLGLHVSAAGVEEGGQSRHLARLGCTVQQGRLFSGTLTMTGIDRLLQERSVRATGRMTEPRWAAPSSRDPVTASRLPGNAGVGQGSTALQGPPP